jgi:SulP family sulfate permease
MSQSARIKTPSGLLGDLLGGLTAGVVALPLALAFGVASGLGPLAGLYGAIIVGLFAAIFGGTPSQVSGPTGPMTVVAATILADAGSPAALFLAVSLGGLLQILLGRLRLGSYIRYIPYPVISGFMTGIGVIIVLLQLPPILGHTSPSKPIEAISALGPSLSAINLPALLLGLGTLAVVYGLPRLLPAVPASLAALIGGTLAATWLQLDVPTIGAIPSGLPSLQLPPLDLTLWSKVFLPAVTLAMLGAIDSLLTSLVADQLTKVPHDSNRELVGQGIGNAVAGLFGGLPGAGATMRTVVNIRNGGHSRLSGAAHSLLLLAVLLVFGPWAAQIPLAVLAGILISVGLGVLDLRGLRHVVRVPRADAAVMLVVLGLTVFVDLIQAVAAGLLMASMLLFRRLEEHSAHSVVPLDALIGEEQGSPVCIARLHGPATFADARSLTRLVTDSPQPASALIIDLTAVPYIDQSGAYALEEAITNLRERDVTVVLAGLQNQPAELLRRIGVVPTLVADAACAATVEEALPLVAASLERPLREQIVDIGSDRP